ncbi:methyltransferase domain-containing protein [Ferrovum sp.]|uniref:methyltransferase domain-containing protein n=1 Tax=Ferrovum sp. TaxID=2609467 RepID=UPI00262AB2F4|nr:methyltransferase domain-containing protein [Ferrovum sp.]
MDREILRLRRGFLRHSPRANDPSPFLSREIGARLLTRLEYVTLTPRRLLDLGAGGGWSGTSLQRRFPDTALLEADWVPELLPVPVERAWWKKWGQVPPRFSLAANALQLPLARHSIDLVWAHLLLPWTPMEQIFAEVARVLAPGGLFLFSTLGPDTLRELRPALSELPEGTQRLGPFSDMHDLGDALVQARLADPVMEREDLHIDYPDLNLLLQDLRALGPAPAPRPTGGVGQQAWQRMTHAYEGQRLATGLPVTLEVIYGQAWKPQPRTLPDGRAVIEVRPAP